RPDLRPSPRPLPRILACFVLAFGAAFVLRDHPVVSTVVGSVVLLGALLLLRAMPEELLVALRRRGQDL
ncbi:MAG TPA: hypothetical protein VNY34_03405, partial [Solirubrobacteraceae bacterium]|nr:hypothetical protein [Solirubrobacteraceae bacterium]